MKFQLGSENEHLTRRIGQAVRNGTVSHAYIIEAPSHTDKKAFALAFAKGILCPGEERRGEPGENCGACSVCDKIDHGNHEDVIFVSRAKGKQTLGIDLIREMQKQVKIKPNGPRYIVIMEDSDAMTEEAQNCLLKTLEEPPGPAVLMLLSENTEQLLPTIRSRCVRLRIEGTNEVREDALTKQAAEMVDHVFSGSPFYIMKKTLGEAGSDRLAGVQLIDAMEERCRQLLLTRNSKGVLYSADQVSECIDALENARMQLNRGMSAPYVMKRLLLTIGG